mmetsp:Transcript_5593/g.8584  ORF Transcript_5593/g.8584 Transcript_5593/m.8584 type:complete len:316 (+) Transcript_5593:66-1013(+)
MLNSHWQRTRMLGMGLFAALFLASPSSAFSSPSSSSKRVLVTGGNKGIGFAICKKLLEDHPDVCVIVGSRDRGRGEKALHELNKVPGATGRVETVELDVSRDDSVKAAFESVCGADGNNKLYGIVNNAGIGFGKGFEATLQTNYVGARRVCDTFMDGLRKPGGRIVNIASASGPNFISRCQVPHLKEVLSKPLTSSIEDLDDIANSYGNAIDYEDTAYGTSKALLNAYTVLHAKANPDLVINSCSPGWILTDLTAGMGASSPPEKGAICPVYLMMSPEIANIPTGRYYGSDCLRSPLDRYRDPGTPAYEPEEEMV